jgi:hypothetical protein
MKNPEGNIGKVFFGKSAEKAIIDAHQGVEQKIEKPNAAIDFVDEKMTEFEMAPDFDGKTTYGKLFKLYQDGESLPPEVDTVIKFKEWYLKNTGKSPKKAA